MTAQTDRRTVRNATETAQHLRTLRNDLLHRLDEFTVWVTQIETALEGKNPEVTPVEMADYMTEEAWVDAALGHIEDVTHIHRGSTDHMHYRSARRSLIRLAATEV